MRLQDIRIKKQLFKYDSHKSLLSQTGLSHRGGFVCVMNIEVILIEPEMGIVSIALLTVVVDKSSTWTWSAPVASPHPTPHTPRPTANSTASLTHSPPVIIDGGITFTETTGLQHESYLNINIATWKRITWQDKGRGSYKINGLYFVAVTKSGMFNKIYRLHSLVLWTFVHTGSTLTLV